jgi:hypothetical protein
LNAILELAPEYLHVQHNVDYGKHRRIKAESIDHPYALGLEFA